MVGELSLPGDTVQLLGGVAQVELLVEGAGERDAAGGAGTDTTTGEKSATESNFDGILFYIDIHDLKNPVDGKHLLLLLLLLVTRDLNAIILQNPAIHLSALHCALRLVRDG